MSWQLPYVRGPRRWAAGLLALTVLLTSTLSARADNLDLQLAYWANRLVPTLEKKGYKNVGVLHFRVERDGSKESFKLGSLSDNLATRVENALIIGLNPDKPLGVIRNATAVAAAKKIGSWYHSESARKELFKLSYPLAWGKKSVKADAFLTGVVKVSKNLEEASLVLEVFDRDKLELVNFKELTFPADRSLLADMGQTFAAGKRGLKWTARDKAAIRDAHKRDLGEETEETVSPDDVAGFMIEVKYDGEKQDIRKDSQSKGEWRVTPPKQGQKVSIDLTHLAKTENKLACVAKVNGKSLWQQQDMESKDCQMWVFAPRQMEQFEGYYMDVKGTNLLPFKILGEAESKQREAEFGSKVGLLELDVFESRPNGKNGGGEPMLISLRGVSSRKLREKPSVTARDLQRRLVANWPAKVKLPPPGLRDLLIVPDAEEVEGGEVRNEEFDSPAWVDHIVIRYYDPKVEMLISK
jgi:hypothetical protein